ncbi:LysR family transcriptional regulator [Gudongella sp. DL1XJH-153]|uniref:LysR family transcriptional regulator n=1 Tax=Gudongella sp. DL1XJH-153 TaxID=3409804 RepID=UPI003BB62B6C
MNIKQIETFTTVANHLSFTKASEEMFITQSSVSKMVKALEDELSVQLFYRAPQIQLTDAGKELYKYSVDILSMLNSIPVEIGNLSELKKGKIKIGIPPIIGSSFFPAVIGKFKSEYPEIEIKLTEVGSKVILDELDNGNLDVGIVCSYPAEKDDYHIYPLVRSPLMIGVHIDNPLASQNSLSFADLKDESFVLFKEDFSLYDAIIEGCKQNDFTPNVICNSSQKDFILEMVASKMGITCLPHITCSHVMDQKLKFIPLVDPKIFLNLLIIWKKSRYMSYASKEWIRFTSDALDIRLEI